MTAAASSWSRQRDLGVEFEPEETGSTFEENARIRRWRRRRLTGLLALADDSGLEVDYLGGRPGIFSARYAGDDRTEPSLSDEQRVRIVLAEMRGVPDERRIGALSLRDRDRRRRRVEVRTVEGVFEGRIGARAARRRTDSATTRSSSCRNAA